MNSTYYKTAAELEYVKAKAFLLLMSDEINDICNGRAGELFDIVGGMTDHEAHEAIAAYEATHD